MFRPIIKILDENVVIFDPLDMNQVPDRYINPKSVLMLT